MKIEINWFIFPLIIYFIFNNKIDTYLIFLIFIIMHEIAHIIIGKINGWKIKKVTFNPLGLNMEMYYYGKRKNKIIYFLAGPILNLIVYFIVRLFFVKISLYEKIAIINLVLCIFNLLPILPLDGGKLVRELLINKYGISKANKISIQISKCFLIIISLIYSVLIIKIQNIIILIVFVYLWYLFYMEDKKFELYKKIEKNVKLANYRK